MDFKAWSSTNEDTHMKLVFISDTHGFHDAINMPEGDILIHSGDISIEGTISQVQKFVQWFGAQKYKHKIFINGNHEVYVWKDRKMESILKDYNNSNPFANIHYLEDSGVEIEGLKFWGSPKTPEFFDWAYMYNRDDKSRYEAWKDMPSEIDVLITHGPPQGVLDGVIPFGRYLDPMSGCAELMKKVKEIKPKVHVFGHIHEHYGFKKWKHPEILFINASTCNGSYKPTRKPIVVDTETWEVVDYGTVD